MTKHDDLILIMLALLYTKTFCTELNIELEGLQLAQPSGKLPFMIRWLFSLSCLQNIVLAIWLGILKIKKLFIVIISFCCK